MLEGFSLVVNFYITSVMAFFFFNILVG